MTSKFWSMFRRALAAAAAIACSAGADTAARADEQIAHLLPFAITPSPTQTERFDEGVRDPTWRAVVYSAPAMPPLARPNAKNTAHALDGIASYYGKGVITASGEPFDKNAMTAAHKTLPMGTQVKVTNLGNGRSAVVRINDRGPFIEGRVIDVSEAAARLLGMTQSGLAPVRVERVPNDAHASSD